MTKNIIVVDANGKEYGATYLKRAKGLVKQGRARFLKPNMLCLACPPDQNLEDNNMSDQTIENIVIEKEDFVTDNAATDNPTADSKYSIEYCLEQIERIGQQTEYLNRAITELCQPDSDSSCAQKAVALSDIVKGREATNQQMLQFYEKMYDDLKAPVPVDAVTRKAQLQEQLLKIMNKTLENKDFSSNEITDMFNGAFDAIRHINE